MKRNRQVSRERGETAARRRKIPLPKKQQDEYDEDNKKTKKLMQSANNLLQHIRENFKDNFGRLVGYHLTAITDTSCEYTFEATLNHFNPLGILHGGALFSAMDSSQGALLWSRLDHEKFTFVVAESSIRYKKQHQTGAITVKTKIADQKRNIFYMESQAFNAAGELLANLNQKWFTAPRRERILSSL